jgi:hypothetical protein
LLANPIQNTLSQLSQTIRFLVANDMLQNVELVPGQAENLERDKNKVVVLDNVNVEGSAADFRAGEVSDGPEEVDVDVSRAH